MVRGNFLALCQKSVHHLNAGQCDARLEPPAVMLPVCSAATSRYLYPMWSAREAHMKHIPVCNARLSDSRFLRAPSYSHKLCISCWRNRVVSGSLQLISRYPTHISSRLHESSLSRRNKGNFAPFCHRHLCLCSLFGLALQDLLNV